jgi:hypothetical protein
MATFPWTKRWSTTTKEDFRSGYLGIYSTIIKAILLVIRFIQAQDQRDQNNASKSSIFGRFKDETSELLISYQSGELTLVRRSEGSKAIVNRTKVTQDTRHISTGQTIEKGEFKEEEVFKKFWLRSGPGENEIEIEEFQIEHPEQSPSHSSKLVGILVYNFLIENAVEKVKVIVNFDKTIEEII